MTLLTGRNGRPFSLRETVMVSFGLSMFVVLGAHVVTYAVTHAFGAQQLAYSEIALGGTARVVNRLLGGA
jgi:hypothetical protein